MAGGLVKYRHLSRHSSHRQALLRNLVTSLVQTESIRTTWPKAKEAQRLAEKLITLAKRNNETSRRRVTGILYTPHDLLPKVFGELRKRYAERPGGYTRVLRTEPKSRYDQGDSAILEFVDGPRDLRFAMTAAAVARDQRLGRDPTPLTRRNRAKVLRYRGPDGGQAFDDMVKRIKGLSLGERRSYPRPEKKEEEKKKKVKEGDEGGADEDKGTANAAPAAGEAVAGEGKEDKAAAVAAPAAVEEGREDKAAAVATPTTGEGREDKVAAVAAPAAEERRGDKAAGEKAGDEAGEEAPKKHGPRPDA